MIDAALIQQCADKAIKREIVVMFIKRAGPRDPLTITVRLRSRNVLLPKSRTPDEALALIRDNLGRNTVRVGNAISRRGRHYGGRAAKARSRRSL